jgi:uncharacterized protein (DUF1330 family)
VTVTPPTPVPEITFGSDHVVLDEDGSPSSRDSSGSPKDQDKGATVPGYVGFLIDIRDNEKFSEYARATGPTMAKHGGRIALRGPIGDVVEGRLETTEDTRLVMLEFGSLESARRWYDSEEYKPLIEMREAISSSRVFFIDGFDLATTPSDGSDR